MGGRLVEVGRRQRLARPVEGNGLLGLAEVGYLDLLHVQEEVVDAQARGDQVALLGSQHALPARHLGVVPGCAVGAGDGVSHAQGRKDALIVQGEAGEVGGCRAEQFGGCAVTPAALSVTGIPGASS